MNQPTNTDSSDILENPFQRLDRYGILGEEPQPILEQIKLLFLTIFVVPLKLLGTASLILSFYIAIKISILFPRDRRSDIVAFLGKLHCRACLFCLGFVSVRWVRVPSHAVPYESQSLEGVHKAFVARDATKRTPLIGTISQAMQCIFVDRSKRANKTTESSNAVTNGVALEVKARMIEIDSGEVPGCRPMLLFPEGTTTNGHFLLPFKTGAFLAGVPLQPVILRYDVHSISPAWESISAARHIFLMLANPVHSVTCYELPVYVPSPEERANPRLYADNLRQSMLQYSGLKDTMKTYDDKLKYHEDLKRKLKSQ